MTHNVEWPFPFPHGRLVKLVQEDLLLQVPGCRFNLNHLDLDDQFVFVLLAFFTSVIALACVEACGCGVLGGTAEQERIALDSTIDTAFV